MKKVKKEKGTAASTVPAFPAYRKAYFAGVPPIKGKF